MIEDLSGRSIVRVGNCSKDNRFSGSRLGISNDKTNLSPDDRLLLNPREPNVFSNLPYNANEIFPLGR